jgi:AraC-like DNA-binding protein
VVVASERREIVHGDSRAKVDASRRTEVVRHVSGFGDWESVRCAPDPRLGAYVSRYEGYVGRTADFGRRMEVPSTDVPFIINFGSFYIVSGPGNVAGPAAYGSFVAGMVDAHVIVESTGLNNGIQVNFTPIGAHLFLGMPMDEITNRTVRFEDIFEAADRRIVARLKDTPDWEARFDLLDAFIADRIARAGAPSSEVTWAWRRLVEASGTLGIGALAGEIGWSRKHLIARFREEIGLPPKTAARVLRFSRAVRQLEGADRARWAPLAYDCGYYDQAHFNREFRQFTGGTPTEFLARRLPDGGGLPG